jgi:hypothetical protein
VVFFAGGAIGGGRVVGSSDKIGGHPASDPQSPENLAATIDHVLGIPPTAAWQDDLDRRHRVDHGDPIAGLRSTTPFNIDSTLLESYVVID